MYKRKWELYPGNFTDVVEGFEIKTFEIIARNRQDVERALAVLMPSSQDEVLKILPKRGNIYEVTCRIFVVRDGPEENWECK